MRDEADIIVTNPPFSLFREFLAWIVEADKQFVIIGNMNAISMKEIFPLLKGNQIWLGKEFGAKEYCTPNGEKQKMGNTCWFTNIDHGRRHQPLSLMTQADNIKFSKHKEIKGKGYMHYDNFDAIDVPYVDAIPSDYAGIMGVPISFMDKYCPEQFVKINKSPSLLLVMQVLTYGIKMVLKSLVKIKLSSLLTSLKLVLTHSLLRL